MLAHRADDAPLEVKVDSFREVELSLPGQDVDELEVLWLVGMLPRWDDRNGQHGAKDKHRHDQRQYAARGRGPALGRHGWCQRSDRGWRFSIWAFHQPDRKCWLASSTSALPAKYVHRVFGSSTTADPLDRARKLNSQSSFVRSRWSKPPRASQVVFRKHPNGTVSTSVRPRLTLDPPATLTVRARQDVGSPSPQRHHRSHHSDKGH